MPQQIMPQQNDTPSPSATSGPPAGAGQPPSFMDPPNGFIFGQAWQFVPISETAHQGKDGNQVESPQAGGGAGQLSVTIPSTQSGSAQNLAVGDQRLHSVTPIEEQPQVLSSAGSITRIGDIAHGQAWNALFDEIGRTDAFIFLSDFTQPGMENPHVVSAGDRWQTFHDSPFADPFQFLASVHDDQAFHNPAEQSAFADAALITLTQDDFRFG